MTTPGRLDVVTAAGLAAVLVPVTCFVAVTGQAPASAAVIVLGAVTAHAAVACRRVAPVAALAAGCAGCLVMLLAAVLARPSGPVLLAPSLVVFPVALYSFIAWVPARRAVTALVVGGTVGLAGATVLALAWRQPGLPVGYRLAALVAVVALAASIGLYRRTQLAYVAALRDRARYAEADRERRAEQAAHAERTRIAREIHDVVSHSLAVMVSQAQGGQFAVRSDPGRAGGILTTIADTGRQALGDMRGLLGVLRADGPVGPGADRPADPQPDTARTADGPQPQLSDLPALLDRTEAAGLAITRTVTGRPGTLSPAGELAAYRLVQEALTNTLKHAGPGRRAEVRLGWGRRELTIEVRDDGTCRVPTRATSTPAPTPDAAGHGLAGMRERITAFGGTVTAGSASNGGFRVVASLPYHTGEESDP